MTQIIVNEGLPPIPRQPRYTTGMALETELAAYRAKLPELMDREGKFVLVHGPDVVDVYTSYEDALKAGYEKFRLEPFMVKQIQAVEPVQFITRFVDPIAG